MRPSKSKINFMAEIISKSRGKSWFRSRTVLVLIVYGLFFLFCTALIWAQGYDNIDHNRIWIISFFCFYLTLLFIILSFALIQRRPRLGAIIFFLLCFVFGGVFYPAKLYKEYGVPDLQCDASVEEKCTSDTIGVSLYFSLITWTTLGYGDVAPVKELRFLSAFQALYGTLSAGILIGIIFNSVISRRTKMDQYEFTIEI